MESIWILDISDPAAPVVIRSIDADSLPKLLRRIHKALRLVELKFFPRVEHRLALARVLGVTPVDKTQFRVHPTQSQATVVLFIRRHLWCPVSGDVRRVNVENLRLCCLGDEFSVKVHGMSLKAMPLDRGHPWCS